MAKLSLNNYSVDEIVDALTELEGIKFFEVLNCTSQAIELANKRSALWAKKNTQKMFEQFMKRAMGEVGGIDE